MSDFAEKLMIEPGSTLAVLRPPESGCPGSLAPTGGDAPYDVVVVFAADGEALNDCGDAGVGAVAEGGVLWVAYPADLGADAVAERMKPTGWEPADEVDLDDDWSAVRFVPAP